VSRPVSLVGLGEDGRAGLSARAAQAVERARVLAGAPRHLAAFAGFAGERLALGRDVAGWLAEVRARAAAGAVCVLASGDPLFFGIGARLVEALGAERVEILPQLSSVQQAFARLGVPWDDAAFLSLHGRPRDGLLARLRRRAKVACLTDAVNTPQALAQHLVEHGETAWTAWACERLGSTRSGREGERVRRLRVAELAACADVEPPSVLVLLRDPGWRPPPVLPFLPDEAFLARGGMVTKREVRLAALAALRLRDDAVVWDVGAGSGSVAIEAALLAPEGRVFAVERDPAAAAQCAQNARRHRADNVRVVLGAAPGALAGLDAPDAVFVGGSGGALGAILDAALGGLRAGGRLVVNAVTLDSLEEARRALAAHGLAPEITLASFARGVPLGASVRLEPLNPVYVLAAGKPAEEAA
jgi:precorrin-6B C5,15-methyltransferase / cobalt-precorrin-6B C5,C15-methyltransferase